MVLFDKKQNHKNIKSIVIGGGFGGIAIALRLRSLGHQVTLIERLGFLGGRAQVFKKNGFKHDAGPTVITAPFLFDELFELFNEKREDLLDSPNLEPPVEGPGNRLKKGSKIYACYLQQRPELNGCCNRGSR